jgi:hypothetical protein
MMFVRIYSELGQMDKADEYMKEATDLLLSEIKYTTYLVSQKKQTWREAELRQHMGLFEYIVSQKANDPRQVDKMVKTAGSEPLNELNALKDRALVLLGDNASLQQHYAGRMQSIIANSAVSRALVARTGTLEQDLKNQAAQK